MRVFPLITQSSNVGSKGLSRKEKNNITSNKNAFQ